MTRTLAVLFTAALAVLLWQSWRLDSARHTIRSQDSVLKDKTQRLTNKNDQLTALSTLRAVSEREQTRLYAAAEQNAALLNRRQRQIEELKSENQELRRWADAALPGELIRLRQRPALAGGAAYREWLSGSHTVPTGEVGTAQ